MYNAWTALVSSFVVAVALSCFAGLSYAESYEESWANALNLEQRGQLEEAISELTPLADEYPQDYALSLQLAWLNFSAGDYQTAEAHYRRSMELSGGGAESRLGLAWSLYYQAERDAAETALGSLDSEGAMALRAQLEATYDSERLAWTIWASGGAQEYGDNSLVSTGRGMTVGFTGPVFDNLLLSTVYRYTSFAWDSSTDSVDWDKHELYLSLGYLFEAGSVSASYGRLLSGLSAEGDAHVLGLSTRFNLLGELRLDTAVGLFEDENVFQLTPSWSIPLSDAFSVRPNATIQVIDGEVLSSGGLTLVLSGDSGQVSFGGWAGEQERRIDLDVPAVYDVGGRMRYGGSFKASLDFDGWSLFGGYEAASLELEDGSSDSELAHWFGFGIAVRFPQ